MNRTINGKSLEQVRRELAAPCNVSDFGGKKYISFRTVEQRMREVLGWNFSFEIIPGETFREVHGGVMSIAMVGKITIYDDDGRVVTSFSWAGGEDQAQQKRDDEDDGSDPRFFNLRNTVDMATQDVFRRTALRMGCCSDTETELRSNSGSSNGGRNSARSNRGDREFTPDTNAPGIAESTVFHLVIDPKTFTKKEYGKGDYFWIAKGDAINDNGKEVLESNLDIKFFKSWYRENEGRMNQFVNFDRRFVVNARSKDGITTFHGTRQLVFDEEVRA